MCLAVFLVIRPYTIYASDQIIKTTQSCPRRINRGTVQSEVNYWKADRGLVASDFMFVNGIPFVVSFSRGVNLTTVEYVSQRLKTVLVYSIGMTFQFY